MTDLTWSAAPPSLGAPAGPAPPPAMPPAVGIDGGAGAVPDTSTIQQATAPELQNLAINMAPELLEQIAADGIEAYRRHYESASEWRELHADWVRIYYQKDRPVNPPWPGSSDEAIPIVAEACTQFGARVVKAMFPSRRVIQAIPTGQAQQKDMDRAERVAKHMSWQLLVQDKRYKSRKRALMQSMALHGSAFTKTYYDPMRGRNVVENVRAEDLIVPYGVGPRELEDIDFKTHVLHLSVEKTKQYAAVGYFTAPLEPFVEGGETQKTETQQTVDELTGQHDENRGTKYFGRALEQHCLLDLDGDGLAEPYIVTIDATARQVRRISIRWAPENPLKEPIEYFTHYIYLPNPDGFYGHGIGFLAGKPNSSVNKLLRQTIDAGSLANTKSGFVSKALDLKKGVFEWVMGKFTAVNATSGRLADNIHEFTFSPPDETLYNVMQLIMMRADRLTTVTEALTGQTDKVQQPTTILSLIDQGLQVFSSVYEGIFDSWTEELDKIYQLNRRYLKEQEYALIQDIGGMENLSIGRNDYADDSQITPVADPKMATEQQKLSHAQIEWQFLSTNALVMQSPPHYYAASKRFLRAIDTPDINEVLPQPPSPMRVDDPKMENMGLLMPQPVMPHVFPDQDHLAHLRDHQAFPKDPQYGPYISPMAMQILQGHMQMHVAMMYGSTETGVPEAFGAGGQTQFPPPSAPNGNVIPLMGGNPNAAAQGQPAAGQAGGGGRGNMAARPGQPVPAAPSGGNVPPGVA